MPNFHLQYLQLPHQEKLQSFIEILKTLLRSLTSNKKAKTTKRKMCITSKKMPKRVPFQYLKL
jgi:hypothetical protein